MYNNPLRQGQTFTEITWGKCPPLQELDFVVSYSDPAYSNKSKPSVRSKIQNSCKVVALVGFKNNKYYLYKCFNNNATQSTFIDWMYATRKYVNNKTNLFSFIENNSLQDPFYQQVLKPLIHSKGEEHGGVLSHTPDEERKGNKWDRVEADLEPLFRNAEFIFNVDEKGDKHMERMASQFLTASITSKQLDGPDAVQGAVKEIKKRTQVKAVGGITVFKRPINKKRM